MKREKKKSEHSNYIRAAIALNFSRLFHCPQPRRLSMTDRARAIHIYIPCRNSFSSLPSLFAPLWTVYRGRHARTHDFCAFYIFSMASGRAQVCVVVLEDALLGDLFLLKFGQPVIIYVACVCDSRAIRCCSPIRISGNLAAS